MEEQPSNSVLAKEPEFRQLRNCVMPFQSHRAKSVSRNLGRHRNVRLLCEFHSVPLKLLKARECQLRRSMNRDEIATDRCNLDSFLGQKPVLHSDTCKNRFLPRQRFLIPATLRRYIEVRCELRRSLCREAAYDRIYRARAGSSLDATRTFQGTSRLTH